MVKKFPKTLSYIGFIFSALSIILAIRIVWEQTVWTWNFGSQAIGFSLIHGGAGIILYGALLLGLIWIATVFVFMIITRSIGGISTIAPMTIYLISWILLSIPYGYWQRIFIRKMVQSRHAAEIMIYAAATGDQKTVEAFIQQGMPIDAENPPDGSTALHAAAGSGEIDVARFLISKGANVNHIDRFGDSPTENALSRNRKEMVKFLSKKGGKKIRGSEKKHEEVTKAIIHENIEQEEMNRKLHK